MEQSSCKEKILSSIYAQINAFDNKASIAISVLGIAFALLIAFLNLDKSNIINKLTFYIIFSLLIAFTIFSIFSFVMVIRPRKRKLYKDKLYPNYYRDIVKMNKNKDLLKKQLKEWSANDALIVEQIQINADICYKKHKWFSVGLFSLVPTSAFTIAFTIILTLSFLA